MPVLLEKRATTGVTWLKCWAEESAAALAVGVKVPLRRMPLACAACRVSLLGVGCRWRGRLTGSEAGVRAEDALQRILETFGGLHDLRIRGERHGVYAVMR
jgi:hypothetical protein